jgi:hypothetical protein
MPSLNLILFCQCAQSVQILRPSSADGGADLNCGQFRSWVEPGSAKSLAAAASITAATATYAAVAASPETTATESRRSSTTESSQQKVCILQ